jgi:hypothetical protein
MKVSVFNICTDGVCDALLTEANFTSGSPEFCDDCVTYHAQNAGMTNTEFNEKRWDWFKANSILPQRAIDPVDLPDAPKLCVSVPKEAK